MPSFSQLQLVRRASSCIAPLVCEFLLLSLSGGAHAASKRLVFAHYMLANQDYTPANSTAETAISNYEKEIQQARAIGIDGFALNAGGWLKEPRYIIRAAEMFEAAYRLHSGFTLFFSADMCCSNSAEDIEDMVRRFANNPRYAPIYYQRDGHFLLSTFAGESKGPLFWLNVRLDLSKGTNPSSSVVASALPFVSGSPSNKPVPIALVPAFFWGGETPAQQAIERGIDQYGPILAGSFYWGIAGVPGLESGPDPIPSSDAYASVLHKAGKLYFAPIALQFWGAKGNRYYEYSGFQCLRTEFLDAINTSHPDAVEIITWNDFVEGTYVAPIDDPAAYSGANDIPPILNYFHAHAGATELLAYYIEWYKTGVQPSLSHDTIYWAYRTALAPAPASTKIYGPMKNSIYVTANLTQPATLHITTGTQTVTLELTAGSHDVQVPAFAGSPPTFELFRNDLLVTRMSAGDPITQTRERPDLYYSTGSMHD